jgi:general secretion pathway protein D
VPGLGDLPLLGRLFSNQRDERSKTEIVLLITPRVLRSDATRQPALTEFRGGTENSIGGGLVSAPFVAGTESGLPSQLVAPDGVPVTPPPLPAPQTTTDSPD